MEIQYLGHACFRLKGKKTVVVTDPYGDSVGVAMPETTADIVTVSHDHADHNNTAKVKKTSRREPFIISAPGEYEVAETFIFGVGGYHDAVEGKERGQNTIYSIVVDGLRVVHLGDLGQILTDSQLGEIGDADVLFVPVGGVYTLGVKEAMEVVKQLEPSVVVPMHFLVPGENEGLGLQYTLEDFLTEAGVNPEPVETLTVLREKLPEEREVIVLQRKRT